MDPEEELHTPSAKIESVPTDPFVEINSFKIFINLFMNPLSFRLGGFFATSCNASDRMLYHNRIATRKGNVKSTMW